MPRMMVHGFVCRGPAQDAAATAKQLDDLADRMAAALEQLMGWANTGDEFRESDHPRAPDGRFGQKAGEHGHAELGPKPTTVKGKSAKAGIHELLSSGHGFTKEELMSVCGIKTEKLFSDYIAMLKNPKYAGPAGALEIVRDAQGLYTAKPKGASPPTSPPGPPPAPPPAPAPAPAPTPAPAPRPAQVAAQEGWLTAYGRFETLHAEAKAYSASAKTAAEHRQAAIVHRAAAEAATRAMGMAPPGTGGTATELRYYAQYHTSHAVRHESLEQGMRGKETARAKLPADHAARTKAIESRFLKTPAHEIHAQMQQRFGLGVNPGESGYFCRGVKPVDISKPTAAATQQRRMLGHVWAALESLESRGFDVKAATAQATKPVEYAPASIGRPNGIAWGMTSTYNRTAQFAVSGTKKLGTNEDQYANNLRREQTGKPRWTISSSEVGIDAAHSTIVHEFTHALGMQPGVDSPGKLRTVLNDFFKTLPPDPNDTIAYGKEHRLRQNWIKQNISEYAASNIHETDAELAAMVTAPSYKRGTLPKAFEDHVDSLFKRRAP